MMSLKFDAGGRRAYRHKSDGKVLNNKNKGEEWEKNL